MKKSLVFVISVSLTIIFSGTPLFASGFCNLKIIDLVNKNASEPLTNRMVNINPFDQKKITAFENYAEKEAYALAIKKGVTREEIDSFIDSIINHIDSDISEHQYLSEDSIQLVQKLAKEKESRGLYSKGDFYYSLVRRHIPFNRIQMNKDETTRLFFSGKNIVAYEFKNHQGDTVSANIEANCETPQISFRTSTYTIEFCKNLAKIEKIKADLPEINEYSFRCQEQGASEQCQCTNGKQINPYFDSCHSERKKPKKTASSQFEELAKAHGTRLGFIFYNKKTLEQAQADCKYIETLSQTAMKNPIKTDQKIKAKSAR